VNTEFIDVAAKKSSQLMITKTLISQAEELAQEHEDFQTTYIVAGRKALYELIGRIYGLAEQLEHAFDREEQVAMLRETLAREYGIRTQENTSDTAVLVRYITRADRKTAHVYARAIEAARLNAIGAHEFVGFVQQSGGLERIRANAALPSTHIAATEDEANQFEEAVDIARLYLQARSELPVASFKLSRKTPLIQSKGAFKHFLACERDGRQYILAQFDVSPGQEANLLKEFAHLFCKTLPVAKRDVQKFHAKAMAKRKKRIFKEITRKRPLMAAAMRVRSEGIL
jgi:hypothetical protein